MRDKNRVIYTLKKVLLLAGLLSIACAGHAQPVSPKPVRIIVPYAAGGASDGLARALAEYLSKTVSQQFVVDNRPGGNTLIGAEQVARSGSDGHTLLLTAEATLVVNPALYSRLPYDPLKDFSPVAALVDVPQGLAITVGFNARNLGEFIDQAKRAPKAVSYASLGVGSTAHLNAELFQRIADIRLVEVSYKGAAPALADLIGGHVTSMIVSTGLLASRLQTGKIRVLAVNGQKRSALLPDVPTFAEAGLPGFAPSSWFALLAPAGTPTGIISKLNQEINKALSDPEFAERALVRQGLEPIGGPPERLASLMRTEMEKWEKLIRETGIRIE